MRLKKRMHVIEAAGGYFAGPLNTSAGTLVYAGTAARWTLRRSTGHACSCDRPYRMRYVVMTASSHYKLPDTCMSETKGTCRILFQAGMLAKLS